MQNKIQTLNNETQPQHFNKTKNMAQFQTMSETTR